MAHLIKLPSVAADTSGGNLHQWLKKEGDKVAVGDALAEIETEKAIVEINAVASSLKCSPAAASPMASSDRTSASVSGRIGSPTTLRRIDGA